MAVYPKSYSAGDFELQNDGRYKVTILATTHNLGVNYHLAKSIKRDSDMTYHNVVPVFKILANGDFEFYVNEPGVYKLYLVGE